MRIVVNLMKALVGIAALVAVVHLTSWDSKRPLIRLVEVTGTSMQPTLQSGDRALFVRCPWWVGSIVMADVGEDAPVVKRLENSREGWVYLCGDNQRVSKTYWIRPQQIRCVMLCRAPLRLPVAVATAGPPNESP